MGSPAQGGIAMTGILAARTNSSSLVRLSLLLTLLALLIPLSANAQAPEQTEAFVYGINASLPGSVVGTFAPPQVDEIFLLADQTSILSARRTLVYYWPITNEYRASWSRMNEQVEGVLEVLQGGEVIASYEQTPYTIHFGAGDSRKIPQLYIGDEAIAANEQFEAEQLAYRQATVDFEAARQEWLAMAREAQARGDDPSTIPAPPTSPTPISIYSTGLNSGFPINLPDGTYQVRTRTVDGDIIPESVRDLTIFAPRRTAVGYELIPEARWTFPEDLSDLSNAVLGEDETVIFLKPRVVREFPAEPYERLQDPQYVGRGGQEWSWISGEQAPDGILELVQNGEVVERVGSEQYHVKQVPGKEYGYEIIEYDPNNLDETPRVDFEGYRVELSSDLPSYEVRLRTPEGDLFVDSEREVRVVDPVSLGILIPIALIPLLLGAGVLFWRHRRTTSQRTS
jgi:hypothetical protein